MELIVGTYEQLILGYKVVTQGSTVSFKNSFTDHSHTGCVRTVAVSCRGILASGSSDETIQLFNLKKRRDVGTLVHHEGSVMAVCFHKKTHMFSASEDGTISVWQAGKWECLRTLKGHRGPVYAISIHPSGKLALSAGKDKTLRTWNLMTAKAAYITNIKQIVDLIQWSPDGDMYILVSSRTMDVYTVETGSVCYSTTTDFRINCIVFIKSTIVLLGGEGGNIHIYSISDKKLLYKFSTGTIRIKGMAWCSGEQSGDIQLATASSDGKLQLWKVTTSEVWASQLLAEVDTKFRLTCLAMFAASTSEVDEKSESAQIVSMSDEESQIEETKVIPVKAVDPCERRKKGRVTVMKDVDDSTANDVGVVKTAETEAKSSAKSREKLKRKKMMGMRRKRLKTTN